MNKETDAGPASNAFFEHPILNSPYECPPRHWELDEAGQPTQKIIERRRSAKFITPIPKPKKRKAAQPGFVFDEGLELSTKAQAYDPTSIINEVRSYVECVEELAQRQSMAGNARNGPAPGTLAASQFQRCAPVLLPTGGSRNRNMAH
jgi:hypothetical protein